MAQISTVPVQRIVDLTIAGSEWTLQTMETNSTQDTLLLVFTGGESSEVLILDSQFRETARFTVPFLVTWAALDREIVLGKRQRTKEPSLEVCQFDRMGTKIGVCARTSGWLDRLFVAERAVYGLTGTQYEGGAKYRLVRFNFEEGHVIPLAPYHAPEDGSPFLTAGFAHGFVVLDVLTGEAEICTKWSTACVQRPLLAPLQFELRKTKPPQEGLFRQLFYSNNSLWTVRGRINVYSGFVLDRFDTMGRYLESRTFQVPQFAELRSWRSPSAIAATDTTGHMSVSMAALFGSAVVAVDARLPRKLVVYQNAASETR